MDIIIRDEDVTDIEIISEITVSAFMKHDFSLHNEQNIILALREANALTLSLVAEVEGEVVGHIAFSPLTVSDGTEGWYGVGPLSVIPELHLQGVGSALMNEGIERLKTIGAKGCMLVGDPGYYIRFGFRNYPQLVLEGVPPEVFVVLPFNDEVPSGKVAFHEAFNVE
jgi:putative acetyltransferase